MNIKHFYINYRLIVIFRHFFPLDYIHIEVFFHLSNMHICVYIKENGGTNFFHSRMKFIFRRFISINDEKRNNTIDHSFLFYIARPQKPNLTTAPLQFH